VLATSQGVATLRATRRWNARSNPAPASPECSSRHSRSGHRRAVTRRDVRTPWYGSQASLSLAAATCLLAGEQIVHGYDIAHTLGRRWPISAEDAICALPVAMTPLAVNPETAHGHTAGYEVRPPAMLPDVTFTDVTGYVAGPSSAQLDLPEGDGGRAAGIVAG